MTTLPFALLLIVAVIAFFEGKREARLIAERMGGPDLDHGELMWRRLLSIGALALLAWYLGSIGRPWQNSTWPELGWMLSCCAIAWASFTIIHRFTLNKRRGFDFKYINPFGNWYDGRLGRVAGIGGPLDERSPAAEHHKFNYDHSPSYKEDVHRAGTLAYIFELTVLAASIVGAIMILHWGVSVAEPTAALSLQSLTSFEDFRPIAYATLGS